MKIRIKGNSIRYRLTKTEVRNFGIHGILEEKTEFGENAFHYALQSSTSLEHLSAKFENNKIIFLVPRTLKELWVNSDLISMDHRLPIGDGKELFLLLEKDFICLDHTHEDQSDNYPNPNKVC